VKTKVRLEANPEPAAGEDEKISKIVDEVDRFFKSVHADVEDWKFSMEDYGDGTRIFVRFQIHFNQSVVPPKLPHPKEARAPSAGSADRAVQLVVRPGESPPNGHGHVGAVAEVEGTGSSERADRDLASFFDLWRRKKEHNLHGEFHKTGAPFLDARSPWNGPGRNRGDWSSEGTDGSATPESTVDDAGTSSPGSRAVGRGRGA
jgi:hypothetical protein